MKIKHERRQLGKLSDSELQDIGISRADVDKECRRHFLDVPTNRTKPTGKIS